MPINPGWMNPEPVNPNTQVAPESFSAKGQPGQVSGGQIRLGRQFQAAAVDADAVMFAELAKISKNAGDITMNAGLLAEGIPQEQGEQVRENLLRAEEADRLKEIEASMAEATAKNEGIEYITGPAGPTFKNEQGFEVSPKSSAPVTDEYNLADSEQKMKWLERKWTGLIEPHTFKDPTIKKRVADQTQAYWNANNKATRAEAVEDLQRIDQIRSKYMLENQGDPSQTRQDMQNDPEVQELQKQLKKRIENSPEQMEDIALNLQQQESNWSLQANAYNQEAFVDALETAMAENGRILHDEFSRILDPAMGLTPDQQAVAMMEFLTGDKDFSILFNTPEGNALTAQITAETMANIQGNAGARTDFVRGVLDSYLSTIVTEDSNSIAKKTKDKVINKFLNGVSLKEAENIRRDKIREAEARRRSQTMILKQQVADSDGSLEDEIAAATHPPQAFFNQSNAAGQRRFISDEQSMIITDQVGSLSANWQEISKSIRDDNPIDLAIGMRFSNLTTDKDTRFRNPKGVKGRTLTEAGKAVLYGGMGDASGYDAATGKINEDGARWLSSEYNAERRLQFASDANQTRISVAFDNAIASYPPGSIVGNPSLIETDLVNFYRGMTGDMDTSRENVLKIMGARTERDEKGNVIPPKWPSEAAFTRRLKDDTQRRLEKAMNKTHNLINNIDTNRIADAAGLPRSDGQLKTSNVAGHVSGLLLGSVEDPDQESGTANAAAAREINSRWQAYSYGLAMAMEKDALATSTQEDGEDTSFSGWYDRYSGYSSNREKLQTIVNSPGYSDTDKKKAVESIATLDTQFQEVLKRQSAYSRLERTMMLATQGKRGLSLDRPPEERLSSFLTNRAGGRGITSIVSDEGVINPEFETAVDHALLPLYVEYSGVGLMSGWDANLVQPVVAAIKQLQVEIGNSGVDSPKGKAAAAGLTYMLNEMRQFGYTPSGESDTLHWHDETGKPQSQLIHFTARTGGILDNLIGHASNADDTFSKYSLQALYNLSDAIWAQPPENIIAEWKENVAVLFAAVQEAAHIGTSTGEIDYSLGLVNDDPGYLRNNPTMSVSTAMFQRNQSAGKLSNSDNPELGDALDLYYAQAHSEGIPIGGVSPENSAQGFLSAIPASYPIRDPATGEMSTAGAILSSPVFTDLLEARKIHNVGDEFEGYPFEDNNSQWGDSSATAVAKGQNLGWTTYEGMLLGGGESEYGIITGYDDTYGELAKYSHFREMWIDAIVAYENTFQGAVNAFPMQGGGAGTTTNMAQAGFYEMRRRTNLKDNTDSGGIGGRSPTSRIAMASLLSDQSTGLGLNSIGSASGVMAPNEKGALVMRENLDPRYGDLLRPMSGYTLGGLDDPQQRLLRDPNESLAVQVLLHTPTNEAGQIARYEMAKQAIQNTLTAEQDTALAELAQLNITTGAFFDLISDRVGVETGLPTFINAVSSGNMPTLTLGATKEQRENNKSFVPRISIDGYNDDGHVSLQVMGGDYKLYDALHIPPSLFPNESEKININLGWQGMMGEKQQWSRDQRYPTYSYTLDPLPPGTKARMTPTYSWKYSMSRNYGEPVTKDSSAWMDQYIEYSNNHNKMRSK